MKVTIKNSEKAMRIAEEIAAMCSDLDAKKEELEDVWGTMLGNKEILGSELLYKCESDIYLGRETHMPLSAVLVDDMLDRNVRYYIENVFGITPNYPQEREGNGIYLAGKRNFEDFGEGIVDSIYRFIEANKKVKFDYYCDEFRKLRHDVFLRDGEKCACCGVVPKPGVSLTIDHIKPVSKFPELSLDIENLQVLCWACNTKKSNKHFTDYRNE